MRTFGFYLLALSFSQLVIGCGPASSSTPGSASGKPNANEKIKDAATATVEAAKAKRDEYAREMSKLLDELNVKYEDLKSRAANAEGQAEKDLDKKLEETKVKRDAAAQKLDELKEAGVDRWEKVKEGVGNAFDDLKKVFD